jgi:PEP-CTERM motif
MELRSVLCIAFVAASASTHSHAQLLGQTLTFQRLYPTSSTLYGPPVLPGTVTVVAGPSDNAFWGGSGGVVIAPEASTITFSNLTSSYLNNGSLFDGYGMTGFSFSPTQAAITLNTSGLQATLSTAGNSLYLGLNGTVPGGAGSRSIEISFAPVPEPTSYALLGVGLAALGLQARRKQRKV